VPSEKLSFSELMKKLSEQEGMLSEEEFLQMAKLIQLTPERELRAWENALFSVRRNLTFKVPRTQSIDDALLLGRTLSLADMLEARYEILREQEDHADAERQAAADLKVKIEELEIGMIAYNTFRRAGIDSVSKLVSMNEARVFLVLEAYSNPKSAREQLDEVKKALEKHGLCLSND
jgi:hypothetical protein